MSKLIGSLAAVKEAEKATGPSVVLLEGPQPTLEARDGVVTSPAPIAQSRSPNRDSVRKSRPEYPVQGWW
jgi:hypothetical protein